MLDLGSCFIGNQWTKGAGAAFVAINPTTREPFAGGTFGTPADVDAAVQAAYVTFGVWSEMPIAERAGILRRLHQLLIERTGTFVQTMAREIGAPLWVGRAIQMGMPIKNLELAISAIETEFKDQTVGTSIVVREPIGVVGAITPWNAPMHQIVAKVGAALAAGCTVVLKPSEVAPATAALFAEAVKDAGVPPGVFNMVFGDAAVGDALVTHPLVNMISFTGSTEVGRKVAARAATGIKKVALELGGKSASILLDETMLEPASAAILRLCFANSGQTCVSHSRFLVPSHLLGKAEELCAKHASEWTMGDPQAESTKLGPVTTAAQYYRVTGYIHQGLVDNATLLAGGPEPVEELQGFFVKPTIFSRVTPEMTIAREEIFGPVLSIMPYDTLEGALAIANGLPYGLSGGVWSADKAAATVVARRMRTGQVALNGAPQNLATPFGGYGESGYGRENGAYGVDEFLNYKAIHGVA